MKIEFTSKEISSYSVGNKVHENDGKPFEVAPGTVTAYLNAKAKVNGEKVPVFRITDKEIEAASGPTSNDQPETATSLASRYNRDELNAMAQEYGLDGNNHTNKLELATAILAAKGA